MVELFVTFIFVAAVLMVKDIHLGKIHNHGIVEENSKLMWYGSLTIGLNLSAMIMVAGPHTGASINPAISVS